MGLRIRRKVKLKVPELDRQGRIRLSRKVVVEGEGVAAG